MGRLKEIVFDCRHAAPLARFWAALLGWELEVDDDGDVVLQGEGGAPILFLAVTDEKVVKNRLHLDLRPDDQVAEVARAEALGARRVDIGQGDETWVVLADPEGNEFCILQARPQAGS